MQSIQILLVEDNEGDIFLTLEAFEEGKITNDIVVKRDGKAAIDYLDSLERREHPDLVLLDVNLPKKNGQEVLSFIKNDHRLKHLPVIMLTTSSSEKDVMESYQNHANCFITKPVEVDHFMRVIAEIEEFWINIVRIPNSN